MPIPRIERLAPDDWPLARAVRVAALLESPAAFGSTVERETARPESEWRERLAGNAWIAAVAEVETEVVAGDGTRTVHSPAVGLACGIGDGPVRELGSMWVAPAHRGSGLAAALVSAVLTWAREDGATSVTLWVVETNARATAFYARCGFAPTGERKPHDVDPAVADVQLRLLLA